MKFLVSNNTNPLKTLSIEKLRDLFLMCDLIGDVDGEYQPLLEGNRFCLKTEHGIVKAFLDRDIDFIVNIDGLVKITLKNSTIYNLYFYKKEIIKP